MHKLKLPSEKVFVNIDKYGNTSAASVPIALDEAMRGGRIKAGDAVIFVAFGAGLTWSNAVVRF
jgi:3-oxoacyl-[acyl-carrier-protein] synthase-3